MNYNPSTDVVVEYVEIKIENGGFMLVEIGDRAPNYYWIPKKIVKDRDPLRNRLALYGRIWDDIRRRTPPGDRERYALYL